MAELPLLTSLRCVEALWHLGFKITNASPTLVTLSRTGRRVFVPRNRTIDPEELQLILLTAGVDAATFLRTLERRTSGEIDLATSGLRLRNSDVTWPVAKKA